MKKEPWGCRGCDGFVLVSHQDPSNEDIIFFPQEGNDEWRVEEPAAPEDWGHLMAETGVTSPQGW